MDMYIEHFHQATETLDALQVIKIGVDHGVPAERYKNIDLYPGYTMGFSVYEVFHIAIAELFSVRTYHPHGEDIEEGTKRLKEQATLSPENQKAMDKLNRYSDCSIVFIDDLQMRSLPDSLPDGMLSEEGDIAIGRTETGIVLVLAEAFEPHVFAKPLKRLLAYKIEREKGENQHEVDSGTQRRTVA